MTVNDMIGVGFVEWGTFLIEIRQRLSRADGNTALIQIAQTVCKLLTGQSQVDNRADLFEMFHGVFAVDDTAPCRDDTVLGLDRGIDPVFDGIEPVQSLLLDNFVKKSAFLLLDEQVGINKKIAELFGQNDPYGAFPTARHAN